MWALWVDRTQNSENCSYHSRFLNHVICNMYVLLAFILGKVSQSMKIIPPCVCDRVSCVFQLVRPEGAMYLVTGLRCDAASRINFLMCFFPKATNYRQTDTPTFMRPSTPHVFTLVASLNGAKPPRRFKPSTRNKALGAWLLPTWSWKKVTRVQQDKII